ncbi:MAG: TlpA disulfide reductase family protein [Pseudomonadota bacterium]
MRTLLAALVLTALAPWGNPAAADVQAAAALRDGDMKKLIFHSAPQPISDVPFDMGDGTNATLSEWAGRYTLVNFWATWCAPCRHEMPMLSELQTEFGGDDFEVVTIATGPNNPAAMVQFFDEIGVDNLPMYQDQRQRLAADMGVFGLPITVLLNPNGEEIARLRGDADWSSDTAKAIIQTLISGSGS